MCTQTQFKNTLVLGLGKTGIDVARYLAPRAESVTLYGGAASTDGPAADELRALGVEVVLATEKVEGHYELAVVSPGISERSEFFSAAAACSDEVIGEPEFAYRQSPDRWVAITGTNGKTTTTSLTTALLQGGGLSARSVGNIGTLVTAALDDRADDEWFVAELSSYQLATSKELHPKAACLLNITPDHLAWHGSMEAYAEAKEKLFQNFDPSDLAVVSVDDEWCRAVAERLDARGLRVCRVTTGSDPDGSCAAFTRGEMLIVRLDGVEHELCRVDDMLLKGEHNVQNALSAAALALEVGVSRDDVVRVLKTFSALEHRIEPCGELDGIHFVNDSKATNTDSVEKALTAFKPGTVVLLLGGKDKGTDLSSLMAAAAADCRAVVCFGAAGPRMEEAARAACATTGVQVVSAAHLAEALDAGIELAGPGDTVLLSPACASFDEFNSFEHRGEVFKQLVAERINQTKEVS